MSNNAILDEVWLSKLARACNIEVETCHRLWTTLYRQIEVRLSLGYALDLGRLGIWSCQLLEEYVAVLDDGMRYLAPPVAGLHISPTRSDSTPQTLALTNLADSLSSLSGATPQLCASYLSQATSLAERLLEGRRELSLPNLGIISPMTDEVSGEVVGFYLEVSTSLREGLNKAFSMFAPVPIVAEAVSKDLEERSIQTLEELNTSERIAVRWHEEESINETTDAVQDVPPSPSLQEMDEPKTEVSEITPLTTSESELPPQPTEPNEPTEEEDVETTTPPLIENRKRGLLAPLLLLALLLGGLLGYIYLKPRSTRETDTLPTAVAVASSTPEVHPALDSLLEPKKVFPIDSPARDNLQTPSQAEQPEAARPKATRPPSQTTEAQATTSTPKPIEAEHITLTSGQGLMQLALHKYGNKVFWVYIYEENRSIIKDFNNIPLGTELTLPSARKYGINANDTNSVHRALILQRALLGQK